MPVPDKETSNIESELLAIVIAAKRDIYAYYDYLSKNAVDVPAPPKSLALQNDKLIRNYIAIERLTDARNALARLAAPVTATQIRISKAVPAGKPDTGSANAAPDIAPVVRRLQIIQTLLRVLALVLVPAVAFATWYVMHLPHTVEGPSLWGVNLIDVALIALPAAYGLLGATASGLRVFSEALRLTMLDARTALQIILNLVLGTIGGAAIGLFLQTIDTGAVAVAFLTGYFAPGFFSRLDDLTNWVFLPKDLQDAKRRTGLDLLQPLNVTTHFAVGAALTILFLFGCMLMAPRSYLWESLPQSLHAEPQAIRVVPAMTILAGALGAWAHVTMDILWAMREPNPQAEPPRIPLPWLRYLGGGAAGTGIAYILPSSILIDATAISAFNPFALVLLALATGYWVARSLETAISSVDRMLGGGSAAVEEGVRRALTPTPLVNYRGYMDAALLDAADLSSCMAKDTANIPAGVTEFVLDLRFGPDKSDDAASASILVEGGVNEGDAVFDVEVSADGFEPRRRRLRVATSTGAITRTEPLNYTILEDSTSDPDKAFRLTVSQSGRVVQFSVLNVALAKQP